MGCDLWLRDRGPPGGPRAIAIDLETRGQEVAEVQFDSQLLSLNMCECVLVPGQGWASVSPTPEMSG